MQIKMVPGDSVGVVTAFYVRNIIGLCILVNLLIFHIRWHLLYSLLLPSSCAFDPQEVVIDLYFSFSLIKIVCWICLSSYPPRTLSTVK